MPIRMPRTTHTRSLEEILDLTPHVPARLSPELSAPGSSEADPESAAPPFLSLKEAADWLCVSMSTLKRLISRGEISTLRVGARRKIPANYLAAYIAKDILTPEQVVDIGRFEP